MVEKVEFRGREDKLTEVKRCLSRYLVGDVLDVGCDAKYLSKWVEGRYTGIDFSGRPDVRVNLENGLPLADRSFSTVLAFDVLEHLDRFHFVFDEMSRVSRDYLIIGLPNMYEWHFRLLMVLGKTLSGKYGLPCEPPLDRHRWLFHIEEARRFVKERGEKNGFVLVDEVLGYYAYHRLVPKLLTRLGKMVAPYGASVFAYHYWAVMKRCSG